MTVRVRVRVRVRVHARVMMRVRVRVQVRVRVKVRVTAGSSYPRRKIFFCSFLLGIITPSFCTDWLVRGSVSGRVRVSVRV